MKSIIDSLKTEEQLRFAQEVADKAISMGIDPRFALALAFRESKLDPAAIGADGEIGLMQVLPSTAKGMGFSIEDLRNPSKNIEIGLTYLKQNLDKFEGDPRLAAAAYNAGPNHPFFSDAEKPLPASTQKYLADIQDFGGFTPTPAQEPQESDSGSATGGDGSPTESDLNEMKMRMLLDAAGAGLGAGAAKVSDIGRGVIGGARDFVRASRTLPGALGVMESMTRAGQPPAPSTPAPQGGALRPIAGGPAGPVGGPASSGAKWLQNWGGMPKEGFSGGVPEAAAQYNKMKPQGQIMQGLAKKGLITPQPVQPGVFTGGQLSISGQPTPPPPPPQPGALSQTAGAIKQGAGAVLRSPLAQGALGGFSIAESAQEADRRMRQEDPTGAAIAGTGAMGGAMQIFGPPHIKAIGAFISAASPLTLYLRENLKKQTPMPEPTEAELMAAERPAFGFYPNLVRQAPLQPRIPAPGTNLPPVEFIR